MDILSTLFLNGNEIKDFRVDNVTDEILTLTNKGEGRLVYKSEPTRNGDLIYFAGGGTPRRLLTDNDSITIAGHEINLSGGIAKASDLVSGSTTAKFYLVGEASDTSQANFKKNTDIYVTGGVLFALGGIQLHTRTSSETGIDLEVKVVDGIKYLHTSLPFYSDSSVSGGGIGTGGGGGGGDVSSIKIDGVTQENVDGVVTLDLSAYAKTAALSAYRTSSAQDTIDNAIKGRLTTIEGLIPSAATSSNKLVDEALVNNKIATASATFRGTSASGLTEVQFLAWANGLTHDNNDYVFWNTTDSAGNVLYKRYKYNGTSWVFEYALNNTPFDAAQWAAVNSTITLAKVQAYDAYNERITALEGGSATTVVTTGSGNVVSEVTKSGATITVNKGVTALLSGTTTSSIPEGTNKYYTDARVLTATKDVYEPLISGDVEEKDSEFTSRPTADDVSVSDGTAKFKAVKGNTTVWNQLNGDNTASVATISGRKYLTRISTTTEGVTTFVENIITSSGASIAVTGGVDNVFDLTQMFGAGNEPTTVAEFEALFPEAYYPYNEGLLLSFKGEGLKTTGVNQFDGAKAQVIGGEAYRILGTYATLKFAETLDGTQTDITPSSGLYTPERNGYIFATGVSNEFQIAIEHSGGDIPTTYHPYEEHTLALPITTLTSGGKVIFPDGMKSAGTVYDELSGVVGGAFTKAVKRIGKVKLKDLNWQYNYGDGGFFAAANTFGCAYQSVGANAILNITIVGYSQLFPYAWDWVGVDKVFRGPYAPSMFSGLFGIKDSAYTDAASFKAHFTDDDYFYYELAEPIEYDLDTPIPCEYYVNDWGTEALIPQGVDASGVPKTSPIKATIAYGINVKDTIRLLPLEYQRMSFRVNEITANVGHSQYPSAKSVYDFVSIAAKQWYTTSKSYTFSNKSSYTPDTYDFADNNLVATIYDSGGNVVLADMQAVSDSNGKHTIKVSFSETINETFRLVIIGKAA